MVLTVLFTLFVLAFALPASAALAYYLFWMTVRLCGFDGSCPADESPSLRFAVVIPAHNEEGGISHTIASCKALSYPQHLFDIFVIADNCTDGTADIANSLGVSVLTRHDLQRRGKGHALAWGFQQLKQFDHDAIVVIDADCQIDATALEIFASCIKRGAQALQAHYALAQPDQSCISYVAHLGNLMEYDFIYAPKASLGLGGMLVGTGMVLHRDLLQRVPWSAHSLVEDAEYTLAIAKVLVPVRFVGNVRVTQAAPETGEQLKVQRARWSSGMLRVMRQNVPRLISTGLRSGDIRALEMAWNLLTLSRPLVLIHAVTTTLVGLGLIAAGVHRSFVVAVLIGLAVGYGVYSAVCIATLGLSFRRAWLLVRAPAIIARMMLIAVWATFARHLEWNRTPRQIPEARS
jgi:cellulose synthase/poly-beta-1,6-N-acetylglucosamine synthase-like glycosyltransferase